MRTTQLFSKLSSVVLVIICLLAQVGPAQAAPAAAPEAAADPSSTTALLQYSAGGHVLGFKPGKAYLAGLDHALTVAFAGGAKVKPVGLAGVSSASAKESNGLPPLGRVSYPQVWPGVEVVYTAAKDGLVESTYVLQPGADPDTIQLKYNTPVQLMPDGTLRFAFQSGYLTESAPVAYQEINGHRKPVAARFTLQNGLVGFATGPYDRRYPLTIDPTFAWHTFYGSPGYDTVVDMAMDEAGNIYLAGYSRAAWNGPGGQLPLRAYSGVEDMVVVKLDSAGQYLWHTFYGSTALDAAYTIFANASGVYVAGESAATWNGPGACVTPGVSPCPLHAYTGLKDLVVVKLDSAGAYQWHTFYGSLSGYDSISAVKVDPLDGSLYLAGGSYLSSWNGPAGQLPKNAYRADNDILVLKLDANGQYLWHTFYGGGGWDYAHGLSITADGVYVAAQSGYSWNGPGTCATPGVSPCPLHQFNPTGGAKHDITVLKLSKAGAYQWHTFYGSAIDDYPTSITVDAGGNFYLTGSSAQVWYGPGGELPLNAFISGTWQLFVLKLNSAGAYQWHTFYGGMGTNYGRDLLLDSNQNLYVGGYSEAAWNGPNAAPLNTYVNGQDMVLLKLNSAGAYQWHAFYGGTGKDEITAMKLDPAGDLYLAGGSEAAWRGPGGVSPQNAYAGDSDMAVFKVRLKNETLPTCANIPQFELGYDLFNFFESAAEIHAYKFTVTEPYTNVEATLTPPIVNGDLDFTLLDPAACDGATLDAGKGIHIGQGIHIGGPEDRNLYIRFNVGQISGPTTYYLSIKPKTTTFSSLPYKLHLALTPPNFQLVNTLILYNPSRFKAAYGLDLAGESKLMTDLTMLAEHPTVNGLLIQLDQFPEVVAAYAAWDAAPMDVSKANAVSDKIRAAMRQYMQDTGQYITDTGYVVIVGDDDQIPFRRLKIEPGLTGDSRWVTETAYFSQLQGLGDTLNTPIDAALAGDWTLSDNFYGDYKDRGPFAFLPSLAVGRLVDTPARIENQLETYLAKGGMVSLSKGTAAVAGYSFLADSAQQACTYLPANGGLTTSCTVNETFSGADLFQKFITAGPNLAAHYGHASHIQLFAPGSPDSLTAQQISAASFNPLSTLWWSIGCHSGLPMPKSENAPLSIPQALADHSVTYIGNTGWAWGSNGNALTYSELLYQQLAKRLRANPAGVGEALRLAKQDYFFKVMMEALSQGRFSFSHYDAKVMAETTLYGLPMLRYTFPGTPPLQTFGATPTTEKVEVQELRAPERLSGPGGDQLQGNVTVNALPATFHPLNLRPWNLTQVEHTSGGDTYYTGEQGNLSAAPGNPILPQSEYFNFDTSLGQARGVIWKGGHYTVVPGNDPLVASPHQLNAAPGAEAAFTGTHPLLPVTLAGLQKLDGSYTNHLTFQTGQYTGSQDWGTLRLFDEMEFLVGLDEASADETPPTLGTVSIAPFSGGLHLELPIADASGIYKAYLTYTYVDPTASEGQWQSKEMTSGVGACTAGEQTYALDLPLSGQTDFFIQVMDCAGNVSRHFDQDRSGQSQYYDTATLSYAISGNAGIGGATITYPGGSTTADDSGNYSLSVLLNWSGTVTPSKIGYTFTPASRSYANLAASQAGQDYTATLSTYTISGNAGISGATLTYTSGSTTANGSGAYAFTVTSGWTGTITPTKTGYTFTPTSITISTPVTANLSGQNFTATATDTTDDVAVYRRATGGAYWLNYNFSTASFTNYLSFGDGGTTATCYPVAMDFDGDGIDEPTHLCGGGWHFFETNGSFVKSIFAYMQPGDIPVPGDYNGDGKDEVAIYRRATGGAYWLFYDFATASFTNYVSLGDGGTTATCYPAAMDFDGDGVDELTHLCGGGWHFFETNGAFVKSIFAYMQAGDVPVPGDYNGDGTDEVAVYRRATGGAYWLNYNFATASFTDYLSFGDGGTSAACYPVAMDFDGDGIAERTHLCGGGWHFFETNGSFVKSIFAYMQVGDKPTPGKYGN